MDYPGKVITKNQVTPTQTSASGNWTLDDQAAAIKNNNWPVALVPNPISKSLRFNSADSAYLNRTPASAGNRRTFTWSGWVKRSALGESNLFSADTATGNTGYTAVIFNSTDNLQLQVREAGVNRFVTTSSVYRDVSSWYHVVIAMDTTQATAANRRKIYVNGVEITAFGTSNDITQNFDTSVNNTVAQQLGVARTSGSGFEAYNNGYMTEVNFIDGQALTPSDFGLTNPQTGQWIPKKYTGTYGTNGFYLNFKDATSTTTLGYDYSGNANNWTTNNFSVTAGSGNDSLTDVPTPWVAYNTTGDVGGVVRGNYATLNPLDNGGGTLANGNLAFTNTASHRQVRSTFQAPKTGKFYCEATVETSTGPTAACGFGLCTPSVSLQSNAFNAAGFWQLYTSSDFYINRNGTTFINSSNAGNYVLLQAGDTIGLAIDLENNQAWISKNNVWYDGSNGVTGNPSAGTNATFTSLPNELAVFAHCYSNTLNCNFGQRPFAYTPPTGFRSLCTTNLPATTIGFGLTNQGDDYFNAVLYTGNGTTNAITGVGFQPDFVWLKSRSGATTNHALFDAVRGVGYNLRSNTTEAEAIPSPNDSLTAFNSDGFTLGANANSGAPNINFTVGGTYVSWNWKAGGTGVTNTAGTITSTVSANTTAGFSIVTYTGTGANATVGHGLGVAPSMVIVKRRVDAGYDWIVGNTNIGWGNYLVLNQTVASQAAATVWNSTAPTSSVFSLGNDAYINASTKTYVAYVFAPVAGYSAFGSYTGNGSTDGPFTYTGFRPRYILIKRTDVANDWYIQDTATNTYNVVGNTLLPNSSAAEASYTLLDILSNGFKQRSIFNSHNASGGTYIYAAFAEYPFQFANAR
jgi:hypothetical protein